MGLFIQRRKRSGVTLITCDVRTVSSALVCVHVQSHPPFVCPHDIIFTDCRGEGVQKIRSKKSSSRNSPQTPTTPLSPPARHSGAPNPTPSTQRSSSVPTQLFSPQQPFIHPSMLPPQPTPGTPTTPHTPPMPYPMMQMPMMAPHPYLPPNGMIPPNGVTLPAYPMYWPPPTAGRPVVHASMLHPHMLGGLMGGHMMPAGGINREKKGEGKKSGVTVLDEISKRTMCPRCEGLSFLNCIVRVCRRF